MRLTFKPVLLSAASSTLAIGANPAMAQGHDTGADVHARHEIETFGNNTRHEADDIATWADRTVPDCGSGNRRHRPCRWNRTGAGRFGAGIPGRAIRRPGAGNQPPPQNFKLVAGDDKSKALHLAPYAPVANEQQ